MSINLIMAEFGRIRSNCGGANLSKYHRLDPTLKTMLKFFPDLHLTVYTNYDIKINYKNTEIKHVEPIKKDHKRSFWRSSNYWKHFGLLKSKYEISIAMDADFYILSNYVTTIIPLTLKFGLCVPMNPRYLVRVDTLIGADSDKLLDKTFGTGFATNGGMLSFHKDNRLAREFLESYCKRRKIEGRGTVSFWRTCWKFGSKFNPYILPIQWCVCKKHVGVGNEIILHLGHQEVRNYYKSKIKL